MLNRRSLPVLFFSLLPHIAFAGPHTVTLLQGKIGSAGVVRGERPKMAAEKLTNELKSAQHPNPGAAANAQIISLSGPGLKPRVSASGDTLRFETTVKWQGQGAPPFEVRLHSNINHAADAAPFKGYAMKLIGQNGDQLHYAVDVPAHVGGTFDAKSVIVKDDHPIAWSPGGNYRFRPYYREYEKINEKLVNVSNMGQGKYGTFEDMIGKETIPNPKGKYTLDQMHRERINQIRLLPFNTSPNTPYSRTSFFDVFVEHSEKGRATRDALEKVRKNNPRDPQIAQLEKQMHKESVASLKNFIGEAHKKGIRVIVDYIANHTGPEVRMLDAFFKDQHGNDMDIFDMTKTATDFEIRANDPTQLALNAQHLKEMVERVDDATKQGNTPSLQGAAPHLYGKWGDGRGATKYDEMMGGGWGQWSKPMTMQLNHGGELYQDTHVKSPETASTRNYVMRDMAFMVLLGVDGFRLDHFNGMPEVFAHEDMNKLQAMAAKYRPGVRLFENAEHFHRDGHEQFTDAREMAGFKATMGATGPEQFRTAIDAVWRQTSMNDVGNHDEGGGIHHYGGALDAFGRLLAINALIGGASGSKMLDEFAENNPIDHRDQTFKSWGLTNSTAQMQSVAKMARNAGHAKAKLPALSEGQHDWLQQSGGNWHANVLVAARYRASQNDGQIAVLGANFHGTNTEAGTFQLTSGAKDRLDDNKLYQAYDYMDNPRGALWKQPRTGKDIKQAGVFMSLRPNQTQLLDIREVSGSGLRAKRSVETLFQTDGVLKL